MSGDDAAARSLADQAATWVPPWKREPATDSVVADAEVGPDEEAQPNPSSVHPDEASARSDHSSVQPAQAEADADEEPRPAGLPSAWADLEGLVWRDAPVGEAASADPEPDPAMEAASAIVDDPVSASAATSPPQAESVAVGGGMNGTLAVEDAVPSPILEDLTANSVSNLPRSEGVGPEPAAEVVAEPVEVAEPEVAEPAGAAVFEDPTELRGAVEAILLVVDEPVAEITLAQVLDLPTARIRGVLEELAAEYTEARRGFELRQAAGGWRLYTRGDFAAHVERFVLDGQQLRLTQAALETLAVIAYKQPVTRSRISAIRGVNCDGVVRTLLSRGLIEDCGSEPDSGAFLYRTTTLFLEKLGINSVDELPPLAPFLPDDVDEIANAQG
ncbi:MAG: scpB [Dactylosporangium sp.]|nr:scpB [Dactylosporangium sp.]